MSTFQVPSLPYKDPSPDELSHNVNLLRNPCEFNNCTSLVKAFGDSTAVAYSHCIIAVVMCVLNMASESCVLYFLSVLKKNRGQSLGLKLSFQLCMTETFICMWFVVVMVLATVVPRSEVSRKIVEYIVMMIATLLATVVYLLKLFVASNEVLKVCMNLR